MPLRETLLNLAITCVLVLIIVLVAIVLKENRPLPPTALPISLAQMVPGPTGRAPLPEFKVFPKAQMIESRANEADTLRIKVDETAEEQVFVLYFVDALDASWTHPQRVQEQGRYFGVANHQRIVDEGEKAMQYVTKLLKDKPFTVMTRWEEVPDRSRFYALILVEISPGKHAYLADLLVQQGYARLAGVTTRLPADARTAEQYALELQQLRQQAQRNKAGIWAVSSL